MKTSSFVLFGTSHVITVLVCITVIAVVVHMLSGLSEKRQEAALHWVRWIVVINIICWRVLFALTHQFQIGADLPVAVCSVSAIALAVYLWRPRQWAFDILFYWIMIGSSLALLMPDLQDPFPSLRFFSMFVTHSVNLLGMTYLFVVRKDAPSEGSYNRAFWALAIYAVFFALPVDRILQANYLYMLAPPTMNFSLLRLMPPWPWYWFVLLAFFYVAFRVTHAAYARYFGAVSVHRERYAE